MLNKQQFLSLLGRHLESCPLDVSIIDEADCGTYKRMLIEYASEPDERIQAYLLVPNDLTKPAGGILARLKPDIVN